MPVRVGVDVGGTFTKAVACDAASGEVGAISVVPTTHDSPIGVAEGIVVALEGVTRKTAGTGAGPILLAAHSTTQAVNALLEGDTALVGVLGIGRRPDLKRASRRTRVGAIRVAPGRELRTAHAFVDATGGVDRSALERAIRSLREQGAEALCVSEAFGVEDTSAERQALTVAADLGLPACAGHELSGLYGLQVRTVTGALNASILPAVLRTAAVVEEAIDREAPGVPLLVMRGDGGAADVGTMRRRPLLTAFSGPAASVAGALHHLAFRDGVVVEVGGTSTNVCTVRGGRPVLSYVRVLDHVTFVRSLDVRVVGVAGGSMLRVAPRRLGRHRITDVGPRSAHIAGLPYCSFTTPGDLRGAEARLIAPRAGDPAEYAIVETPEGRRFAPTLTCAANAVGLVPEWAYANGERESSRLAFEALGRLLGTPWREVAGAALDVAARKVADVAGEALSEHEVREPSIVGLGGGAGALVPALAERLGLAWTIPPHAEVISSIGDALSLVRVEVERSFARQSGSAIAEVMREAEEAAVAAGAAPASVQVETEAVPDRRALRAVATGAVALRAGSPGSDAQVEDEVLWMAAKESLGEHVSLVARTPFYGVFTDEAGAFAVIDRHASVALTGRGLVLDGSGSQLATDLEERLPQLTRHLGPISVAPAVRLVRGARLIDLTVLSTLDRLLEAAIGECRLAGSEQVVALIEEG